LTPFDYAVLFVLAASLLVGVVRGVVSEILALAAWLAAFLAARWWAAPVGHWLLAPHSEPVWQQLAGFAAVFVAVLVLFAALRWLLTQLLKAVGLRPLDRLLGALFGVLRGALLVWLLVLAGGLTPLPQQPWWRQAVLAPPLESAALAARPWLPREFAERLHYR